MPWTLDPQDTLQLPINELAMRILRDYRAGHGWNMRNWIIESQQHGTAEDPRVRRALSEGWAWLIARGLVAKDPEQHSADAYFVTRLGIEALDKGAARMESGQRLGVAVHPRLAQTVERQFLLGEYELAVFAAMKEVEVRVRELGGFPNSLIGVPLMQEAFNPNRPGPLADTETVPGEQIAMMDLFKGSIGVFKNPASHRPVEYEDPVLAAEIVLLADLLLRILDRFHGDS